MQRFFSSLAATASDSLSLSSSGVDDTIVGEGTTTMGWMATAQGEDQLTLATSNSSSSSSSSSSGTMERGAMLVGTTVHTPYGTGTVLDFRTTDGMYRIELWKKALAVDATTTMSTSTPMDASAPTETPVDDGGAPIDPSSPTTTPATTPAAAPVKEDPAVVVSPMTKTVLATLYSPTTFAVLEDPAINLTATTTTTIKQQQRNETWNDAFQTLEKTRKMNLEMECHEAGLRNFDLDDCKTCLLTRHELAQKAAMDPTISTEPPSRFPRLQKLVDQTTATTNSGFSTMKKFWGTTEEEGASEDNANANNPPQPKQERRVVLPRIQKLLNDRQKATVKPCLVCACNCCSKHSSTTFSNEGITMCNNCERFFALDFIVDCVSTTNAKERAQYVEEMVDLYDRCLILLQYSAQYIDACASALEKRKEEQNRIGLGSSGVGLVSGVLGVAAAATILTPAGPPLLIASLVFGGGATAVQTGTEAMNYYSEPNKLADRIIALHAMLQSLLRVTSTLRDAMLRDHIRLDAYGVDEDGNDLTPLEQVQDSVEKNRAGVLAASNVGRSLTLGGALTRGSTAAVAGTESTMIAGRTATALSRAGTAAARTIRFARFAGGALSAAVLLVEANAIQNTVKSIRDGSPCEKASTIRQIAHDLSIPEEEGGLPSTRSLSDECHAYLATLANRPMKPQESITTSSDTSNNDVATQDDSNNMDAQVGTLRTTEEEIILEQEQQEQQQEVNRSLVGGSTLLQRIQIHKQRELSRETSVQLQVSETPKDLELNLVV